MITSIERSDTLIHAQWLFGAILIAGLLGHAPQAEAVKSSFWRVDDIQSFLEGEHVEGVAVESDGTLTLGSSWDSVVTRLEGVSYIWCLARDSKGRIYFGTGDNGRIYRWTRGGGATLLWQTGAAEITCMAIDAADNVYAGSAPGGVVFRVGAKGDTTRYFETGEESIWSLLPGKDGALFAGTGSHGKIFRITGPGKGSVYVETKDINVLALAVSKDGALLAGTASKGLLIRVERDGSMRVIYDADSEELHSIAVLDDGSIVVGTNRTQAGKGGDTAAGHAGVGDSRFAIEVTPRDGGKCGVFLVQPDGSARLLFSPPTEFLYAMIPFDAKSVLVATGEPAALFRVRADGTYALLGVPEEKQILALVRGGEEIFAATGNDAILYAVGAKRAGEGTYTSQAYDLHSVASWGRGIAGITGEGDVSWSTRSGMSEEPDDGWSRWSKETSLRQGSEITSPPARFLQFRLRVKHGGGGGPVISSVEVSYLQRNLQPEIGPIQIFGPDNPYTEGGPEYRPPQISQTYPSGLKVEYTLPRAGPKQVSDASAAWARGIRTVAWQAYDPNGDALRYEVSIKADDEKEWRRLVSNYTERLTSFDSESYPNGQYRIKVEATDEPDNPISSALRAARTGAPFRIDNLPPRVEKLGISTNAPRGGKSSATVSGSAVDDDTRITSIEYSVDGNDWMEIFPEDGIYDALREGFRFEVKDLAAGEHRITVRASDLDRNVAVAKVLTTSH